MYLDGNDDWNIEVPDGWPYGWALIDNTVGSVLARASDLSNISYPGVTGHIYSGAFTDDQGNFVTGVTTNFVTVGP